MLCQADLVFLSEPFMLMSLDRLYNFKDVLITTQQKG